MSTEFDIDRALRWLKPQRWTKSLSHRPDEDLPFVTAGDVSSAQLMLDTCVYLDVLQGRTPQAVDALITTSICNHSASCLAELTHLFGRLDPADARTPEVLDRIKGVLRDMSMFRTYAAATDILGAAGIVAGLLRRLSHREGDDSGALLIDACLYLQARKLGFTVLTRNIGDFDLLNQIVADGRVIFYRTQ